MLSRSLGRCHCMSKYLLACIFVVGAALQAQQPTIPTELGTAPLTGDAASNRSNSLAYGLTVSTAFDDNATDPANVNQGRTNLTSSIQPQTALSLNRGHISSRFSYSPGYTYSSDIGTYNASSQSAGADVKYLFTKRLSLHFVNAFSLTTNPYETFQANSDVPSLGILNRPNESALGANTRNTTEQSQADLVYQLGRHTSVGAGGTFTDLRYKAITSGNSVNAASVDSCGWSVHAFYSHQWTARYSFGIQYTAQQLSSDTATGEFSTLSHQVLGFVTIAFRPTIHLSVFAGPQRSEIDNNYLNLQSPFQFHTHRTSFAGGSSLIWQGEHNGLSANFVQQISDSGFNGGASVLVRTIDVQMQRQLTARSSVRLFGTYVSNNQLDPVSAFLLTDYASAGVGFSKSLTQHVTLNFSAQRQQLLGATGNLLQGYRQHSHDIGTVSLSYNFIRPIGR